MPDIRSSDDRRRKYALFNLITSVLVQAVNIVVGLLIPRALISVYGDEVNGLISTVTQIFNFFQLLEGGVSVAAAVALYRPFAEGDTSKIAGIYRAIAKYYRKSGEILLGLSVATGVIFGLFFRESQIGFMTIFCVVIITGLMNSLNFLLLGKFNVICDADQHTFVLHIFTVTARIAVSALQYVFILLKLHVIIVQLPLLLMVAIRLALTYIYVRKKYPYILEKNTQALPFNQKNEALVIQICNLVKRNAPMLVIACTGNLVVLSIYNIYAQIFHATSSLFEMSSQSMTSNFGNLAVTEEEDKIRDVYRKAEIAVSGLVAIVTCCYIQLTIPFMQVYSRDFTTDYIYLIFAVMFSVSEMITNLGVLPRLAAISCGYIKESRNPAIADAAVSFALGFPGYILFGLNGLMAGCIIGGILRTGYHIYLVSSRIIKRKMTGSVVILSANIIFMCLGVVSSFFILKLLVPSGLYGSYLTWLISAVAVFLVSAIIVFGGDLLVYRFLRSHRRV